MKEKRKMKEFDNVIIGSGFRALITAYFCLKKKKNVIVISNSKNLSGVLKPIEWDGAKIDKGYQFFDGLDLLKNILEECRKKIFTILDMVQHLTNGKI